MAQSQITRADRIEDSGATPEGRYSAAEINEQKDVNNANATDTESRLSALEANAISTGFIDYADLTTATTPIAVTALGSPVKITNDGAGANSNSLFPPQGVTDIWDTGTNEFDFSELALGDEIAIRLQLMVTTTSPNQNVDVDLRLALGTASEYVIPFGRGIARSAGLYQALRYNGIYIGNSDTLTGGGFFEVSSGSDCDVEVVGWYCKITKHV
jgi:hypothetical protein